jgi:predicted dehydrogenase
LGITIGVVGTGQFAPDFISLFKLHPDVDALYVTDLLPERARAMVDRFDLAGAVGSFDELLAARCDAVAVFTQRWTHGPLVLQALPAGVRESRFRFFGTEASFEQLADCS